MLIDEVSTGDLLQAAFPTCFREFDKKISGSQLAVWEEERRPPNAKSPEIKLTARYFKPSA